MAPNDQSDDGVDRRKFLAGTAGASLSPIIVGSASANGPRSKQQSAAASGELTLTEDDAMSQSEATAYANRMAEVYDDVEPAEVVPDVSTDGISTSSSPNTENLTFINSWSDDDDIYSDGGTFMAKVNNLLTLYKGTETDDLGRNVYFFWHWSQTGQWNEDDYIRMQSTYKRNHLNITDSSHILHSFDPEAPIEMDGDTYPIALGVSYKGVTMSISSEISLGGGVVKPETDRVETGYGGEFSVAFDGCENLPVNIMGTSMVYSHDNIYASDFSWNWYSAVNSCWDCFC